MTPWSVRPSAGWSKAAARAARASTLHAPSSSEYSEWTCRWAQAGVLTDVRTVAGGSDARGRLAQAVSARCGVLSGPRSAAAHPREPGAARQLRGGLLVGLRAVRLGLVGGRRNLLAQPRGRRVELGRRRTGRCSRYAHAA